MTMTVKERADTLATFRYIEVRLMEITSGWTPITAEMEVKVLMGLARLGKLMQFVPHPVTSGFTMGIAVVIGVLQVKDALGRAPSVPTRASSPRTGRLHR